MSTSRTTSTLREVRKLVMTTMTRAIMTDEGMPFLGDGRFHVGPRCFSQGEREYWYPGAHVLLSVGDRHVIHGGCFLEDVGRCTLLMAQRSVFSQAFMFEQIALLLSRSRIRHEETSWSRLCVAYS